MYVCEYVGTYVHMDMDMDMGVDVDVDVDVDVGVDVRMHVYDVDTLACTHVPTIDTNVVATSACFKLSVT